ncbi:MAG: hypothetical protein KDK48_03815 [Chlamydiia bacterium]|nr:hypothetical protein [Chlamydiia bacterium]
MRLSLLMHKNGADTRFIKNSWDNTAKGNSNTPLLNELAILEKLLEINPDYTIYYQDGFQKDDVLVAEIL